MALDLTAFFAEAKLENARIGGIIRGLENLSNDNHLSDDKRAEVLVALELYKRIFAPIASIADDITELEDLKYPVLPTFPESPDFKKAIDDEVLATQAASEVFIAQEAAVNGPLLLKEPIGKV